MKKTKSLLVILLLIYAGVIVIKLYYSRDIEVASNNIMDYSNKQIAIYVENESGVYDSLDIFPLKDDGYIVNNSKTICSNNASISWDNNSWSAKISKLSSKNTKCYIYFDKTVSPNITINATINGAESDSFPSSTSGYYPDSITCTNGASAVFDYSNWSLEVDAVKNTVCTINFETGINNNIGNYFSSKLCNAEEISSKEINNCLIEENGYRFEGENPNNYILFNDELWRIIGVFNIDDSNGSNKNLVKIIRNTNLEDLAFNSNGTTNSSGEIVYYNDWASSSLMEQLNNIYYNKISGDCNIQSSIIKPCNFENKGLNTEAQEMVASVKWNVGKYSSTNVGVNEMYNMETNATWIGKVALMSASDYGYSVLSSYCDRNIVFDNYRSSNCAGKSWLYQDGYQRTLNAYTKNNEYVLTIHNSGYLYSNYTIEGYGVRPVVYLNEYVKVLGGNGTSSLPYVITN